jgi:hypothetical protein
MIKIDYVKREQLPGDNIGQQVVKATIGDTQVVIVTGLTEEGVIWLDRYRNYSLRLAARLRDAGRMGVSTIRAFDPSLNGPAGDYCEAYISAVMEWTGTGDGHPSVHAESSDAAGLLEEVFEDTVIIAGRTVRYGGLVIAGRGYLAVYDLEVGEVGCALQMAGDAAMAPKWRDAINLDGFALVPLEASLVSFRDDLNATFAARAEAEARAMMTVVTDYLNKLDQLDNEPADDGFVEDRPYARKWPNPEIEE